jgi:hypothetical protein
MSGLSDVAHAILLLGAPTRETLGGRKPIMTSTGQPWTTFRSAAEGIGSKQGARGLGFFDSSRQGKLAFGPGAGLVVGVSVGAENVRAVLVDANGWEYHAHQGDHQQGQLAQQPDVLLARIKTAIAEVLEQTFKKSPHLLVDGALPLLGCAVAWPTPVDRAGKPAGHALSHPGWRSQELDRRVTATLGIDGVRSYRYVLRVCAAAGVTSIQGFVVRRLTIQPSSRSVIAVARETRRGRCASSGTTR